MSSKKLCKHPIPETSTEEVIENIIVTAKGDRLEAVRDLIDFYNCPVCSRWRKITSSEGDISININIYDHEIPAPKHNKQLSALEVFAPYSFNLYPQEIKSVDLGFYFVLPEYYAATFSPSLYSLSEGLLIQSHLIVGKEVDGTYISIFNPTDKNLTFYRRDIVGYFSFNRIYSVQEFNFAKVDK